MTYRLSRVLLAQLSFLIDVVVVVVRRIGLAPLGGKLVGNGALVLGVQVLVAAGLALLVTLALVDL